ncbi:MAG: diaminopimelate epimerase [Bacillota bacterium]|nr:diaminopimelate epimerase [Bacillota bacterium]
MNLHFYKMHGIGNDYVYVNGFSETVENPSYVAKVVSDRHFGIGSDGLILMLPSKIADVRMQMFNADGSEGKMCGNGIRCVGKLAYLTGVAKKETITVETLSGIKTLKLHIENENVKNVTVDMGAPELSPSKIPVKSDKQQIINEPLNIDGNTYNITCVSMGNPHAVIFTNGIDDLELEKIGPKFEHNDIFPESVNTEFVEIIDDHTLKMRVWERGSGETWACGTGACATVVAACLNGHCKQGDEVTVHLRGGDLSIVWNTETLFMTGGADLVFTGDIEI